MRLEVIKVVVCALLCVVVQSGTCFGVAGGTRLSVSSGYMVGFDKTEIWVDGLTKTFAGADIVLDASVEGPRLAGGLSPFGVVRWRFAELSNAEDLAEFGYIDADGALFAVGLMCSFVLGESSIGLRAGFGHSWETLDLNFKERGIGRQEVDNNTLLGVFGATMSLPFLRSVDVTIGWDLLVRPGEAFRREFSSGRAYRIQTAEYYGTGTVGVTWK